MRTTLALTLVTVFSFTTVACAMTPKPTPTTPDLSSVADFPVIQEGQARHVIWLAEHAQEELLKVEIVPGKLMMTDCNTRGLMGSFSTQELSGWGYNYYQLENVTGPISTMMACPDDSAVEAFVPVHGDNFTLRYNSKLPIVIYAPQGIEVRYRIWTTSEQLQSAIAQ